MTIRGQRLAPSYHLGIKGLTIGRSDARDVILFDPAASRNHAQLEVVGDDVWLRDHGSGNGTFVNGSRVREQCLRHGDRLRVGSTEFRFELLDGQSLAPPTLPPTSQEARVLARRPLDEVPKRKPGPDRPVRSPRILAVAAMGAVAGIAVMILGGVVALYVVDPALNVQTSSPIVDGFEVPVEARPAVARHLRRGHRHYEEGNYLKAASQYYAAQRLVPGHPGARRFGVLSTENLMLSTLREGLVLRNLPDREKKSIRNQALRLGNRALSGREDSAKAIDALRNVLVIDPDDTRVRALLGKLKP